MQIRDDEMPTATQVSPKANLFCALKAGVVKGEIHTPRDFGELRWETQKSKIRKNYNTKLRSKVKVSQIPNVFW